MIAVVNYGLGNISSIVNMIKKVGGSANICSDKNEILKADKIILPGVGSFDHGIKQLHTSDLFFSIQKKAFEGTFLLGICLGMQLLGKCSEEGQLPGLGLIDAEFKRFTFQNTETYKVPHVGWNHVLVEKPNSLLPFDNSEQRFYFTHSYHAICKNQEDVLATTDYGYVFPSAYCRGNVYGVQFHPEKSHRFGMALMKRFVEL